MGLPSVQYCFGTDVTIPIVDIPDHRVELSIEVGWLEVLRECLKIWISAKQMRCEQLVTTARGRYPSRITAYECLDLWSLTIWGGKDQFLYASPQRLAEVTSPHPLVSFGRTFWQSFTSSSCVRNPSTSS